MSIDANRLVIFCGAGLSIPSPSDLPSARDLAQYCAQEYQMKTGASLPNEVKEDLEGLAEYFEARDQLYATFISRLIPRRRFFRNPNAGHFATADFLASGVVECVVSTNFDGLIEEAAKILGEPFYVADIDGDEANIKRDRRPHLKIHGCLLRDDKNTLWCKAQLTKTPLKERHEQFRTWLAANLRERDLIFVGFWSDWSYLNAVFEDALGGIDRGLVVIVNRSDEETLKTKAPQLWDWSSSGKVARFVVNESADEFLAELRAIVWRTFAERLHRESTATYSALTGKPLDAIPAVPPSLSVEDLYALHLDACGVPLGDIARIKCPNPTMQVLGAVQLGLMAEGATIEGNHYVLDGLRIRVIYGQGRPLSDIRRLYLEELRQFAPADIIICVGAKDDGGVPPDVARDSPAASTIVRPTTAARWVTEDNAKNFWMGDQDVATASH
jgi:hypothetical protein